MHNDTLLALTAINYPIPLQLKTESIKKGVNVSASAGVSIIESAAHSGTSAHCSGVAEPARDTRRGLERNRAPNRMGS